MFFYAIVYYTTTTKRYQLVNVTLFRKRVIADINKDLEM